MMRTHSLLIVTLALLGSAACSTSTPIGFVETAGTSGGPPVPVPPTFGGAGMGAAPYVPTVPANSYNDQPFTTPSNVSADWVGYLENSDPNTEAIRLHFGVNDQGQSTLTVVRGSGPPPAPPTDAYDQWPDPYVWYIPSAGEWGSAPGSIYYPQRPIAGFVYTAREVTWQGSRLRFEVNTVEPWSSWCALQTSYPHGSGKDLSYTCDINLNGYSHLVAANECQTGVEADKRQCILNHQFMCQGFDFCDCNATGCGPVRRGNSFDITFYGDHADGSTGPINIRLMPAAP
jgi:hypothetical protein